MQSPIQLSGGTGVSAADVIFELATNAERFNTWQLGSTAGVMNVFVSGDGTHYQTAAVAMIDLGSTSPSTAVPVTTAGGNYGIRGRWRMIKVLQSGGTAVANGYLIGSEQE